MLFPEQGGTVCDCGTPYPSARLSSSLMNLKNEKVNYHCFRVKGGLLPRDKDLLGAVLKIACQVPLSALLTWVAT